MPDATHWDIAAPWYDALVGQKGSDYHRTVVLPGALRLLDVRAGQRVLDVGCGQGVFCRELALLGADVVGTDASEKLLAAARRRASSSGSGRGREPRSPGRIAYEQLDARQLEDVFWPPFDRIACLLALQNLDPLEPVLRGCGRLLVPGGKLVLVLTHPAFRIPRQSGWGWDEPRKLQYRRVDHYLTPLTVPIQIHPGAAPELTTWTFHRPLQDYIRALVASGMLVDALEEWPSERASQPGARARAENRARAEIPLFLAVRGVKP